MKNYVTHLECALTGEKKEKNQIHGLSNVGKPLLVRYDLKEIRKDIQKNDLKLNEIEGLWRYAFLLPVDKENRISLGEVQTPLISLDNSKNNINFKGELIVKDEGVLPTASFKARGLCLAVSMAKQLKLKHLAIPTNGNAGAALAAYASKANIKSTVFCPDDTPEINIREIQSLGADTYLVNGLINECGKLVLEGKNEANWFDVSTLKEPYRIEGKKTMGLELAEQFNWELPDVIFYPTGGGTGLIGMWKAFAELLELGWIEKKLPKMVAVQSEGCAPIYRAWKEGKEFAELWQGANTIAAGIRVPIAVGDFLIIRAVNESNGFSITVSDKEILKSRDEISQNDGMLLCPEGAATYAAFKKSLLKGIIKNTDKVVLFNCASGLKYPLPEVSNFIDKNSKINFSDFKL
jgi:threonine synthase